MLRIILLLVLFSGSLIYSQPSESFGSQEKSGDYILKFSLSDLLTGMTFESTTIQFGLEKGISKNQTIEGQIGYLFHAFQGSGFLNVDLTGGYGFALETEFKNYFSDNRINSFSGHYVSLDLLYRFFYAEREERGEILNQYSVYRNECGVFLKYGFQTMAISGFVSDFSIGAGWRYLTSNSDNQYQLYVTESEFPYNKEFNNGTRSFFSVTAAIKIGWSLK